MHKVFSYATLPVLLTSVLGYSFAAILKGHHTHPSLKEWEFNTGSFISARFLKVRRDPKKEIPASGSSYMFHSSATPATKSLLFPENEFLGPFLWQYYK